MDIRGKLEIQNMSKLDFIPYDGAFTDFLITSHDSFELQRQFVHLGATRIDRGAYSAYFWSKIPTERLFTGLGVLDGRFVVGPRSLPRKPESFGTGSYAVVDISTDTALVRSDPFGMHVLYAGRGLVTNRLHLAAIAVGQIDYGSALSSTYNEGVFSFSFNTFSTPVSGVDVLKVGDRALVNSSLLILSEEQDSDFETVDPERYHELISLGASEIAQNVEAVLDSGFPVTCDITGGRDSRIIFAALVALGRIKEVSFNTNTTSSALGRDLEIGTGLVQKYGGHYGAGDPVAGYATHSVERLMSKRRSQLYGCYHFITPGELRSVSPLIHGYSLRMLGGGGELYRDYYQSLFTSVDQQNNADDTLVESMFRTHCGSVYGESLLPKYIDKFINTFRRLPGQTIGHKLDSHYLNFRNRFHFGPRISAPAAIMSINPGLSKYVLKASRSLPLVEKAGGRVLFDVIKALNEQLAYLPFDKESPSNWTGSVYHMPSIYDRQKFHLDSALHLVEGRGRSQGVLKPVKPQVAPVDFRQILSTEIDAAVEVLESTSTPLSAVLGSNLDSFVEYARTKSDRHYSASASRLRAFSDFVLL